MSVNNAYSPPVIPKTPTMSVSPSDATLESSTSVTVTCTTTSSSSGSTEYTFLKDGVSVATQPADTYTMSSVTTSDSGTYTCKVTIKGVESLSSNQHTLRVVGE